MAIIDRQYVSIIFHYDFDIFSLSLHSTTWHMAGLVYSDRGDPILISRLHFL